MSPVKFYLITGTAALTLIGLGFYVGWERGRDKFADECISIGNFVVYDYGLEKQRRFKCEEAPLDKKILPAIDRLRCGYNLTMIPWLSR